jgi:hypothetical protein
MSISQILKINKENNGCSVAIPRDIDVIFGIISKTKVARFGKENSRKYFISVSISLGYAPVYGEKYKLSIEYWIFVSL